MLCKVYENFAHVTIAVLMIRHVLGITFNDIVLKYRTILYNLLLPPSAFMLLMAMKDGGMALDVWHMWKYTDTYFQLPRCIGRFTVRASNPSIVFARRSRYILIIFIMCVLMLIVIFSFAP